MTASEELRELIQGGAAYVERGELGNQNVVPANKLMDALMDSRYELLAVVEAAEQNAIEPAYAEYPQQGDLHAALAALDKALS